MIDKKILSELKAAVKEEREEAQNGEVFEACAKMARGMYTASIIAGFNEEQSLYLTATFLTASLGKAGR